MDLQNIENQIDSNVFKNLTYVVGLIGSGNMAYAIGSGLVKKGLNGRQMIVSSRSKSSFHNGWKSLNVAETLDNFEVINKSLITILCCKPNNLDEISKDLIGRTSGRSYKGQTLISILAGKSLEILGKSFHFLNEIELLRAMPNTPLQVALGAVAVTPCNSSNKIVIESLFKALGMIEFIEEKYFDAITGLSGSGPAYVYTIIDALTDAGIREGLSSDLARKFAAQTCLGAAQTVLETKKHPAQLKNEVCSPGGTTIRAVYELEKGGLRAALMNAVQASADRSREMNK